MTTYISQQKVQLLDSLENQVYFSKLVAVLVGDKGIGKSFLLKELCERLNTDIAIAYIDASLAMSEDQLDKTVSLQLGLSWQKTEISLENRINNDLDKKVLVVIDDAHLLSSSCLNFILELNQTQIEQKDPSLFIILAGDNRLPNMINQTDIFSVHQDMCVVFQIEAIEKNEIQHLIAYFSGSDIDSIGNLYDTKKLASFWKLSKGNPAELNYHMFRELDEQSPIKVVDINNDKPASYFKSALYVLIAIILMSILVFQKEFNNWISNKEDNKVVKQNSINVVKVSKKELLSSKDETLKTVEKSNVKPMKEVKPSIILEQIVNEKVTQKNIADTEVNEIDESAHINLQQTDESESILIENNRTSDENDLLNNNSNNFVLQWTGVSQLKTAAKFKTGHPLSNQMKIYRRSSNNKLLYLVVSGNYQSKALAEKDKKIFRKQGITGQPWVKSNSAIHKEIIEFSTK